MEKTEMMKRYEETTYLDDDPQALIQIIEYLKECIQEYKTKAGAYDRVISSGLSMKEIANILKHPVAIENEDDQNELYYFDSTPYISQFSDGTQFWSCKRKWRLPRQLVNFNGNWEDSLAFPDGWGQS
jgi:hypothetical protein